jgi:hypothetical protein
LILPSFLILLAGAPKTELGIVGGIGYMPGEAVVAPGRDEQVVDAVRNPWSAGAWFAYQWIRGHDLGVRYQYWQASQKIEALDDYEGGEETLDLTVYGVEYTRLLPLSGASLVRIGGGAGFAKANDVLDLESGDISAEGDGWAGWMRGALSTPLGTAIEGHVGLSTTYIRMAKMKSRDVQSFESDYLILQAELGLSFGL